MRKVKVGVVGLGNWGRVHAETYMDHPAAELTALCDSDEQRLRQVAGQCGGCDGYTDVPEMLAAAELDAVSVVTPDFAHADVVVQALCAGKAVLVEKPLATTMEDCDRIGEALQGTPGPLMVDFHNRWSPGIVRIREDIAAGQVGTVRMVYCRLSDSIVVPTRMLPWAGRSGVNWFLGSHCLDTLRWLLDDEVERLYTVVGDGVLAGRGVQTPDYYLSVLEFGRGTRALLENCWILPQSATALVDFKLEVVAERGSFRFDGSPHRLVKTGPDGPECPDTFISPLVRGRRVGFATRSIRHFVDCLIAGEEPMVGYEDGREVTRLILAMERSAAEGGPVTL